LSRAATSRPGAPLCALAVVLAVLAAPGASASAAARAPAPKLASVRCWPPKVCASDPHVVSPGGRLRFKGRYLRRGMVVIFKRKRTRAAPASASRARIVASRLRRTRSGWQATVPVSAGSGRIRVAVRNGPRSNAVGPIKVKPALQPATVLDGTGMWIWQVSRASGGDPAAIAAQARQYGVRTVLVKSSDGTSWWSQFSPELVSALKAGGLRVCAWQFVYGGDPAGEAALGARAAQTGADCLLIDAESQYQGRYAQAQTYLRALRSKVGGRYPVGLASFPYVDYHPGFPYSVFLGPDGAQYNLPQMYWRAIGTSVDEVYAHTFIYNRIYKRALFPLGQLYSDPPPEEVQRFRQLARAYGAAGLSWWSWQHATPRGFAAVGAPLAPLAGFAPAQDYPGLRRGAGGDVVVWAQQHLVAAGQQLTVDGDYGAATEQAVRNFQASKALAPSGALDGPTWTALLGYQPAAVNWAGGSARSARAARSSGRAPRSAELPAVRDEIGAKPR
jgi:hypothetical protein